MRFYLLNCKYNPIPVDSARISGRFICVHTQWNIFWIFLNQTNFGLYLPFSDWIGAKRNYVWCRYRYSFFTNTDTGIHRYWYGYSPILKWPIHFCIFWLKKINQEINFFLPYLNLITCLIWIFYEFKLSLYNYKYLFRIPKAFSKS